MLTRRRLQTWVISLAILTLATGAHAQTAPEQPPQTDARPAVADPLAQFSADVSEQWIADTDFVWGARLAAFNLPDYLARNAPHLSAQAEFMAHWCGFYSISPKVLLTILETQSALVSSAPSAAVLGNPLAGLVPGAGFEAQVLNALSGLYQDFYAYRRAQAESPAAATTNAATYALLNLLRGQASAAAFGAGVASARGRFVDTLSRMFPEPLDASPSNTISAVPPTTLLQFPWQNGVSWYVGGVHTTTGSNDGSPMSSLDSSLGGQGWGSDTSTSYVVAAHSGTVTVYSSCNVRVTHSSGWQTNYYHLGGVIVSTGQQVTANQTLGVYAGTQAQALCQGGSSTGPHVHYSLLFDGTYNSLDGVTWNGYEIHPGRFSYDTDPNYMWLIKDGVKTYANTVRMLSTASTTTPLPNMTINDVSISEGNSGTKTATFTVSLSSPASGAVTVNYATSDVTTWSASRSSSTAITIPEAGVSSPYPSTLTIPSNVGTITKVTAVVRGFTHSYVADVNILLQGPTGTAVMLLGDSATGSASNLNLTFDDTGTLVSPVQPLTSSTYRPADGGVVTPTSPAPARPYQTTLAAFNGTNPSGTWRLYVFDDASFDSGSIAGWTLNIATTTQADFVPASGVLTIANGTSSQTLGITINGDTTVESSETFEVNLSGATNAVLTDSVGIGTITNDDAAAFTDATLTVGTTVIKAVHITELRTRINSVRAANGLDAFTWTNPTLTAGSSTIQAVHLTEMRTALNQAYAAAGRDLPSYTDASLTNVMIKAVHIADLRAAVIAIE